MAEVYTDYQSMLDAGLGEYRDKGFRLVEKGDHFLFLYRYGELVGRFSQEGATIPAIRGVCQDIVS